MSDALGDAGFDVTSLEDPTQWQVGRDGSAIVIGIADTAGLDVLEAFKDEYPHIPVIAVVTDLTLPTLAAAVRSGATSAVDDGSGDTVAAVVEAALSGMSLVPERMIASMAQLVPDEAGLAGLVSDDELSWLRSMAGGMTVAEISEQFGYSERAMFRNLRHVYLRIGVRNRTEALIWASTKGLLNNL